MKSLSFFLAFAFTILSALNALAAPEKAARTDRGTAAPKATVVSQPPAVPANPPAAAPATASSNDVPGQLAADFFNSLQRGQIDDAYASLTKGSKTIEKPEDLRILKQKTREAIEAFGAIVGYELVDTTRIGGKLMRRTYLSLGEEFPLRWRFYFYEAKGRWRLIDLRVDDRLSGMFDEPKEGEDKGAKP